MAKSSEEKAIEIFDIKAPFNAPDGIYELRLGSDELSEADYTVLGKIQIGNEVDGIKPYTATIQNLKVPYTIEKNVSA